MSKTKHVGFQLNPERPIDKRCIDILEDLPKGDNACSYIRKSIIFYSEHMEDSNGSVESTNEKLDYIIGLLTSNNIRKEENPKPVEEVSDVREKPEKKLAEAVSDSPATQSSAPDEAEISEADYDDFMGDFLE